MWVAKIFKKPKEGRIILKLRYGLGVDFFPQEKRRHFKRNEEDVCACANSDEMTSP